MISGDDIEAMKQEEEEKVDNSTYFCHPYFYPVHFSLTTESLRAKVKRLVNKMKETW